MIRRIVNWFAYLLHIKKRERKSALETLLEILPVMFCFVIIMSAFKWIGKDLPPLPWHRRFVYFTKYRIRYLRAVLIGY